MTPRERENPQILNASRKKRIAAGCGLEVVDVNRLLKSVRDAAADDKGHDQGQVPRSGRYDGRYAQYEPDARLRPEEAAEINVCKCRSI